MQVQAGHAERGGAQEGDKGQQPPCPLAMEEKELWSWASRGSDSTLPLPGCLAQGTSPFPSELSFLICGMGDYFWKADPDS